MEQGAPAEHSPGGCHGPGLGEGGSGTVLAASYLCAQVLCDARVGSHANLGNGGTAFLMLILFHTINKLDHPYPAS